MKIAWIFSPVLLSLLILTGCLMEPVTGDNSGGQSSSYETSTGSSSSSSSSGVIPATITVTIIDATKSGIEINPISVTQALVVITNPSGSFQQQLWRPGLTNVLTFYSYENGLHYVTAIDYDELGGSSTNGVSCDFTTGYDYMLYLSVGGYMVTTPYTNTNI